MRNSARTGTSWSVNVGRVERKYVAGGRPHRSEDAESAPVRVNLSRISGIHESGCGAEIEGKMETGWLDQQVD